MCMTAPETEEHLATRMALESIARPSCLQMGPTLVGGCSWRMVMDRIGSCRVGNEGSVKPEHCSGYFGTSLGGQSVLLFKQVHTFESMWHSKSWWGTIYEDLSRDKNRSAVARPREERVMWRSRLHESVSRTPPNDSHAPRLCGFKKLLGVYLYS